MDALVHPRVREAHDRRVRIRSGVPAVVTWLNDVTTAAVNGDWKALEYESWDAYCDDVIGARLQIPREDRREFVLTMRQAGMSTRAIGTALGVSKDSVHRDLASVSSETVPEAVRSLDGRERPTTQPPRAAEAKAAELWGAPTGELVEGMGEDTPLPDEDDPEDEPSWTAPELQLHERLMAGEIVVVSYRVHTTLIDWCTGADLLVRIDRRSDWGNPFETPADGPRDAVIYAYATHYLPNKPSLLARLDSLCGKALACWCAPAACHGDILKQAAEL